MKRVVLGLVGAAVLLVGAMLGYLLLAPVPVEPHAWQPLAFEPTAWSPSAFPDAQRTDLPDGYGPEDIEVDAEGRVYAGLTS